MNDLALNRALRRNNRAIGQAIVKETPIYDEGTWTPTYFGATTAGVTTYTTQQGSWTRIGRCIFFTLSLQWTAATGTGTVRVSLPFAVSATTSQNFSASIFHQNVTFANGSVTCFIQPTASSIRLLSPATNAAAAELVIEAAGQLTISGFYFVD